MKLKKVMRLINILPTPSDLKGYMPGMNQKAMIGLLLNGEQEKLSNFTLMGLLLALINKLADENPDYQDYVAMKTVDMTHKKDKGGIPEPCGDPDCESCKQLEAILKEAHESGAEVKVMHLSKQEAMEMGLIDEDGNDITPDAESLH